MEEPSGELKELVWSIAKKVLFGLLAIALILGVIWVTMGFVSVEPQSVKVIKAKTEINGISMVAPRALVNEQAEGNRRFYRGFPWPGKKTGYVEEEYSTAKPLEFLGKKGLYLKYEETGEKEDRDTVVAYVIYGKFKVKDWKGFVESVDPDSFNAAQLAAGAPIKMDRMEIVTYAIMSNLDFSTVDSAFQEFVANRNLAVAVAEKGKIKTLEELVSVFVEKIPWYLVLGANGFEEYLNSAAAAEKQIRSAWLEGAADSKAAVILQAKLILQTHEYEKAILANSLNEAWESVHEKELLPFYGFLGQQIQRSDPEAYLRNQMIWGAVFKTVFLSPEETTAYFRKEFVPVILAASVDGYLANFPFLEVVFLEVKLEERPLFSQEGVIDPDFQDIYQANAELFGVPGSKK